MGEKSNTVLGLFTGTIKFGSTIGGVIVGAVGLITGNWAVVVIGVGMFVLGQVVHAIDQRTLDVQLERWAGEANAGFGPLPPRPVRMQLMRSSAQTEGMGGDMKRGFQMACRAWAADQEANR